MINNRARSFVAIMVVIAVSALFLRLALEKIIKINIEQNQINASTTIKLISTALENFAKDNKGSYPENLASLADTQPPYLDKSYITPSPLKGYSYTWPRLEASGYSCSALPVLCGITGKEIYTISTGALLVVEKCDRKK